ncbi:LamB/YcsF family protein [Paenibacillus sp. 32O-W]|uniref:LamB/YcsF family protein n=1 Tax=Paenibacillus sp. 32O-W TaxID=1695218 RepID=UPI0007200F6B|nr:5-oxoprolinase subunit PxpA [Paenibacillus sp. 32O-W]ALS29370.1 LamB/YcsF family protein [Paenibacillus sp. 32O-W]
MTRNGSERERSTAGQRLAVDLNCDFGEGFGPYAFGHDDGLLEQATSVNIACGFHAGDPHTMRQAVERAVSAGAAVGAHPGLPDRLGFGRREMAVTPDEVYDFVVYQIGALDAFVRAAGGTLHHVKPHGALYHMAGADEAIAEAVVRAAAVFGSHLFVYGQSGTLLPVVAERCGLTAVSEVFADRAYRPDGRLADRRTPGALLERPEQILRQALAMVLEGRAYTPDGAAVPVRAQTICLHGDGRDAAYAAQYLRRGLQEAGIAVEPPRRNFAPG